MITRRGDNIPSVDEYAHWNEEAEAIWYLENKYDMEHADEIIEDDFDERDYYEPAPDIEMEFDTEQEAKEFCERPQDWGYDVESLDAPFLYAGKWCVEGYSKEIHAKAVEINRKARFRGN